MIFRAIPKTGEQLPAIGLGTWKTFDIEPSDKSAHDTLGQVLQAFHSGGARLIDSSPMYGNAETTIGTLTGGTPTQPDYFYATKVWTKGRDEGIRQMNTSFARMQCATMDLMQIHNLLDWEIHLKTLREWKDAGTIRYIGITHYTDDAHAALEQVITSHPVDFVQFNYSLFNRHAEQRLLQVAADHQVATLINRPFGEGQLFRRLAAKPLPNWAQAQEITSWNQFLLKYILAHPAVTCVIPATANPVHATSNMKVGKEPLPDETLRKQMREWVTGL